MPGPMSQSDGKLLRKLPGAYWSQRLRMGWSSKGEIVRVTMPSITPSLGFFFHLRTRAVARRWRGGGLPRLRDEQSKDRRQIDTARDQISRWGWTPGLRSPSRLTVARRAMVGLAPARKLFAVFGASLFSGAFFWTAHALELKD